MSNAEPDDQMPDINDPNLPRAVRNLEKAVWHDPRHYILTAEQRDAIKTTIPEHYMQVATQCKQLKVNLRISIKLRNSRTGTPFEASKFFDMRNLIRSYASHGYSDLLGYANAYHFKRYRDFRRIEAPHWGETEAEKREREVRNRVYEADINKFRKKASIVKPDVVSAKGMRQKWAIALEYPDVRDFRTADVMREAPLTFMRLVIRDLEKAAEVLRHDPANKKVVWFDTHVDRSRDGNAKYTVREQPFSDWIGLRNQLEASAGGAGADATKERIATLGGRADAVRAREELPVVCERAEMWMKKALRHYGLYKEMLEEWVDENHRRLNIHAVVYNLYYNDHQVSVADYLWLMSKAVDKGGGEVWPLCAVLQFNHCHDKYLKDKAAKGWAKLRYWTFIHFPNRMTKIAWYWRELGAQHACRPADPSTGFSGGSEYRAAMAFGAQFAAPGPQPVAPFDEPSFEDLFPVPAQANKIDAQQAKRASGPRKEGAESGMDSDAEDLADSELREKMAANSRASAAKIAALQAALPSDGDSDGESDEEEPDVVDDDEMAQAQEKLTRQANADGESDGESDGEEPSAKRARVACGRR